MASSERLKIRLNDKAGRIAAVAAGIMVTLTMTSHHAGAASCRTDALAGIDWRECNKRLLMLGGSNLDSAMLYGTDFTYTDLRGSTLKGANMEKAKLIRTALGKQTCKAPI